MPDVSLNGLEFEIKGSTDKASDSISKLINQLGSLKSSIGKTGNVGKLTDSMKQIDKSAKSANKIMGKLTSSILRIGFYRIIRSAIKSVTDAFKEGLTNAYQFSKLTGGELASSLDLIATKSLTMKNQMGAAFGGLIVAITPIVIQLIKIINAIAAAVTRLIAIISGRTTWLRAKDVWTEWGEAATGAGAAAKEALKYLAPFDELNRLPDDNARGGRGGNAIPDYSEMFEEVPTSVGAGLFDTITEVFKSLGNWFKGKEWENVGEQAFATLKSIFGDKGKASELVSTFFNTLGSAFGAVLGFAWGFLKSAVEDIFKTFKENIRDYDGDNKIGIVDILTSFYETTNGALLDWIWNNIAKPFWDGLKSTLLKKKEDAIDLGDLEIKIDLKSGIKNIGNWFKKNVLTPIVNKINEFIDNYPVIAKMLGLKEGTNFLSDTGSPSYKPMTSAHSAIETELKNSGTFGINVDANVTNIKDSVPQSKKILGDVAAKITSLNDVVPIGKKIVNGVKAVFNSTQDKTTQAQKTLSATAKFTSSKDSLTSSQKTVSVLGRITSALSALTSKPSLDSRGLITTASSVLTSRPVLDSLGRITDTEDWLTYYPRLDSWGRIVDYYDDMYNYVRLDSWGRIVDAYSDMYYKPTIECVGLITMTTDGYDIRDLMAGLESGGAYYGGAWHSIPQAASGGQFHGSLFWAGENGPEVVGHAGGRTEVLNRSQLAATMHSAVSSALSGIQMRVTGMGAAPMTGAVDESMSEDVLYRAMLRALNDSDVFPDEIDLDGDVVYRKIVQRNRQEKRRMGVNPMMA